MSLSLSKTTSLFPLSHARLPSFPVFYEYPSPYYLRPVTCAPHLPWIFWVAWHFVAAVAGPFSAAGLVFGPVFSRLSYLYCPYSVDLFYPDLTI